MSFMPFLRDESMARIHMPAKNLWVPEMFEPNKQPTGQVKVRDTELTKNLFSAIIFDGIYARDHVRDEAMATSSGTPEATSGLGGAGVLYTTTEDSELGFTDTDIGSKNHTYFFIRECPDATARDVVNFGCGSGASQFICHLPWSDGTAYFYYQGANELTWAGYTKVANTLEVWCVRAGDSGMAMYYNGVKKASSGTAVERTSLGSTAWQINDGAGIGGDDETVYGSFLFTEELSDDVIARVSKDIYNSIFESVSQPMTPIKKADIVHMPDPRFENVDYFDYSKKPTNAADSVIDNDVFGKPDRFVLFGENIDLCSVGKVEDSGGGYWTPQVSDRGQIGMISDGSQEHGSSITVPRFLDPSEDLTWPFTLVAHVTWDTSGGGNALYFFGHHWTGGPGAGDGFGWLIDNNSGSLGNKAWIGNNAQASTLAQWTSTEPVDGTLREYIVAISLHEDTVVTFAVNGKGATAAATGHLSPDPSGFSERLYGWWGEQPVANGQTFSFVRFPNKTASQEELEDMTANLYKMLIPK